MKRGDMKSDVQLVRMVDKYRDGSPWWLGPPTIALAVVAALSGLAWMLTEGAGRSVAPRPAISGDINSVSSGTLRGSGTTTLGSNLDLSTLSVPADFPGTLTIGAETWTPTNNCVTRWSETKCWDDPASTPASKAGRR